MPHSHDERHKEAIIEIFRDRESNIAATERALKKQGINLGVLQR